jgi:hypothetical protein
MFRMIPATTVLAGGLALSACGESPAQRAVTGGMLGAGTGAASAAARAMPEPAR